MTQPRSPTAGAGKEVSAYVVAANVSDGWFGTLDLSKDQTSIVAMTSRSDGQPKQPRAKRQRLSSTEQNAKSPAVHPLPSNEVGSTKRITATPDHTYYGSTSSVSTFQEAVPPTDRSSTATAMAPSHESDVTSDKADLELGCWIIAQLEDVEIVCAFAEKFLPMTLVSPVATLVPVDTVRTLKQLGKVQHRSQRDRRSLARGITQNSAKSVQIHADLSVRQFLALFVGENLRWEFIALIFAWAGRAAADESPSSIDLALPQGFSHAAFTQRMTECSSACITMQQQSTTSSDMLVWCLYENLILLTNQHGEASTYHVVLCVTAWL